MPPTTSRTSSPPALETPPLLRYGFCPGPSRKPIAQKTFRPDATTDFDNELATRFGESFPSERCGVQAPQMMKLDISQHTCRSRFTL